MVTLETNTALSCKLGLSGGPVPTWTEAWAITSTGDILGQYGLPDNTIDGSFFRNAVFYLIDLDQPTTVGIARF